MRAVLLLASAFGLAAATALGREVSPAPPEHSLKALQTVRAQIGVERQIALEEIAAGVVRGDWTEEDADEARRWLDTVISPPQTHISNGLPVITPISLVFLRRSAALPFVPPIVFLKSSMDPRLTVLSDVMASAAEEVLAATAHVATKEWIAARKPEDLAMAVKLVTVIATELGDTVLRPRGFPFPGPRGTARSPSLSDFLDVCCLVTPEPPLLFPDPQSNPSLFRDMWRYHLALRTTERGGFFDKPAVAAHIARLRAQYEVAGEAALDALRGAVLAEAPIGQLAAAVERVEQFSPLSPVPDMNVPRFDERPAMPDFFGPRDSPALPNYRLLTERWVGENPPPSDYSRPAYQNWLAYRQAEEVRDRRNMHLHAARLRENQALPPDVWQHIARRLDAPVPPVPRPEKARNAVQNLRDYLAANSTSEHERTPSLDALVQYWAALSEGAEIGPGAPAGAAALWAQLAEGEGRHLWFVLREKALRELLEEPRGPLPGADRPLSIKMREQFDGALEKGDTERAAHLLVIDAAGALLAPAERAVDLQAVQHLATARAHVESGRVSEARSAFRALIAGGPAGAAAIFAATELRRLSKSTSP